MHDVLIAGAGPAGSVAATLLARVGVRVQLVDRARFPRDKLCGDSLNPGALACLRRLGLAGGLEGRGLRVDGMLVTGPGGVRIEGRYPPGLTGRIIRRRELDQHLLELAVRAGADFEEGVAVRGAAVTAEERGVARVGGVRAAWRGRAERTLPARVTIAADGRRSALAFGLGLARHPPSPRRWAVGACFDGVLGTSSLGEMHVRSGGYFGVAPLGSGLTNGCLVTPGSRLTRAGSPASALYGAIGDDPELRERFAGARIVTPPIVLGPLAVELIRAPGPGLLLAGDAAGFIDPMTGDGLRFAVRGAELAADAALELLESGRTRPSLARRRRAAFAAKWRFNRALRRLVDAPGAVTAAALGARLAPAALRALIRYAGDCGDFC